MTCRRCHENVERRMRAERELKDAKLALEKTRIKMDEAAEMLLQQFDENQVLRERLSGMGAPESAHKH